MFESDYQLIGKSKPFRNRAALLKSLQINIRLKRQNDQIPQKVLIAVSLKDGVFRGIVLSDPAARMSAWYWLLSQGYEVEFVAVNN